EIQPGEVVGIVGFSGAGKSTLIALLAGLVLPDAGQVTFRGTEVRAPGPERGVVFQNYSLLPWLTAAENVSLAVEQVFSDWSKEKQRAQTERFIHMVGLDHASERKPAQLSGGMRQRVALARGPAATLGPEFSVHIPRPRERRALNLLPEFRHLRSGIIDYLLSSKRSRSTATSTAA